MSENNVRKVAINTTINGQEMDILVDPYVSLLETLREVVGMTGTKEGCNDGNCGACTINIDGRIVDSCLVLGVEAEGKNETFISRIRKDNSKKNAVNMWIVSDNLLRGAALNAVEIAEAYVKN